ncbi:MAG: 50S ribosomal protein L24e [Nitrososphaerota archaeon]|nr:50S ribosomal protein L24e [Nitrososphaerota archaeon]MDG6938849.1 50S ribosomal protein L24e [Nitrososphaerota archaeon]
MLSVKKCSFCGKDIMPGTGLTLVKNDGSVLQYCSSKCRMNHLKLRRDPRKLKWTTKHVKGGKGL